MDEHLYVATGADGIERTASGEVVWDLPHSDNRSQTPGAPVAATSGVLVLRRPGALLEELDERIFVAEPVGAAEAHDDEVTTQSARLVAETRWDAAAAARFALECAAHALESAEDTKLPDGTELSSIIAEARATLDRAGGGGDERIGFLARLAAVRRLRKLGEEVSETVLATMTSDLGEDVDALDDPAWTSLAACSEAVLAALEALRHVALPRYARSREEAVDEHPRASPPVNVPIVMTPWGPIGLGAEHQSSYEPAWAEARDAAMRAREAARDRGGDATVKAERDFQAELLEQILGGAKSD